LGARIVTAGYGDSGSRAVPLAHPQGIGAELQALSPHYPRDLFRRGIVARHRPGLGLFVGMVLGLQGYDTLVRYGSSDALGVLVSLSLVRELGPVVAGLLFASRAGSAITAEIGLMKATEQLSPWR